MPIQGPDFGTLYAAERDAKRKISPAVLLDAFGEVVARKRAEAKENTRYVDAQEQLQAAADAKRISGAVANQLMPIDGIEPFTPGSQVDIGALTDLIKTRQAQLASPKPAMTPYQEQALALARERDAQAKRQFEETMNARKAEEARRKLQVDEGISKDIQALRRGGELAKLVTENYSPTYTGAGQALLGAVEQYVPVDANPKRDKFRAATANLRNMDVKEFAGSAVSASEWKRVKDQLPDPYTNDATFAARWNTAAALYNALIDKKEADLKRPLGLERWQMLPESPAQTGASTSETATAQPAVIWERVNGKLQRRAN